MTLLSLTQTLIPPPLNPQIGNPNPKLRPRHRPLNAKVVERGVEFEIGDSFRAESAVGRDIAVLAAALHRKSTGSDLRILDAMCGCGVRVTRYLAQAGAGFVWANDAFEGVRPFIVSNLSSISPEGEGKWVVTHCTANRLMTESYLKREYFDVVDVDSFGSEILVMVSLFLVEHLLVGNLHDQKEFEILEPSWGAIEINPIGDFTAESFDCAANYSPEGEIGVQMVSEGVEDGGELSACVAPSAPEKEIEFQMVSEGADDDFVLEPEGDFEIHMVFEGVGDCCNLDLEREFVFKMVVDACLQVFDNSFDGVEGCLVPVELIDSATVAAGNTVKLVREDDTELGKPLIEFLDIDFPRPKRVAFIMADGGDGAELWNDHAERDCAVPIVEDIEIGSVGFGVVCVSAGQAFFYTGSVVPMYQTMASVGSVNPVVEASKVAKPPQVELEALFSAHTLLRWQADELVRGWRELDGDREWLE